MLIVQADAANHLMSWEQTFFVIRGEEGGMKTHCLRTATAFVLSLREGALAGEAGTHSPPCPRYLQKTTDRKKKVHTRYGNSRRLLCKPVYHQQSYCPLPLVCDRSLKACT